MIRAADETAAKAALRLWPGAGRTSLTFIGLSANSVYAVRIDGAACYLRLTDSAFRSRADVDMEVVRGAAVPVLGGEHMNTDRAALELTHGAIAAGAAGIVMGRNIWQAPDPAGMVRALRAIIHDGASVDGAVALL